MVHSKSYEAGARIWAKQVKIDQNKALPCYDKVESESSREIVKTGGYRMMGEKVGNHRKWWI